MLAESPSATPFRGKVAHALIVLGLGIALAELPYVVYAGIDRYTAAREHERALERRRQEYAAVIDALRRGDVVRPPTLADGALAGANLAKLRLDQGNLVGADLRHANLRGANLDDALLWLADLREADLSRANLRHARVGAAKLQRALLRDAQLDGADLGYGVEGGLTDLRGADLRGASLRNARMVGAQLQGADLRNADLSRADLRGANLESARLEGTRMERTRMRGTDLTGATGVTAQLWHEIALEPAIEGVVRTIAGDPADGALVTYGMPPHWEAAVHTDRAGHFQLMEVPLGLQYLAVWRADMGGSLSYTGAWIIADRTASPLALYLPDPRSSTEHIGVPIELRPAADACDGKAAVVIERTLSWELARRADGYPLPSKQIGDGFYQYGSLIHNGLRAIDGVPVSSVEQAYQLLEGREGSEVWLQGCLDDNRQRVRRVRYRFPQLAPPGDESNRR